MISVNVPSEGEGPRKVEQRQKAIEIPPAERASVPFFHQLLETKHACVGQLCTSLDATIAPNNTYNIAHRLIKQYIFLQPTATLTMTKHSNNTTRLRRRNEHVDREKEDKEQPFTSNSSNDKEEGESGESVIKSSVISIFDKAS